MTVNEVYVDDPVMMSVILNVLVGEHNDVRI